MTNEEILNGNKLIAEFMGFSGCIVRTHKGVKYDYTLPSGFDLIKEVETTIEGNWCEVLDEQDNCFISDLKFHFSWDWLMPVVEKIETLGMRVKINTDYCNIGIRKGECVVDIENESKINAVWLACVSFIGTYNRMTGLIN